MRISDWSSDVCSSDLEAEGDAVHAHLQPPPFLGKRLGHAGDGGLGRRIIDLPRIAVRARHRRNVDVLADYLASFGRLLFRHRAPRPGGGAQDAARRGYAYVHHSYALFVCPPLYHAVSRVDGAVYDVVAHSTALERAYG